MPEKVSYNIKDFSLSLKRLREYRGIKHQCDVAKKLNISRQVFSLWEIGKRLPDLINLTALANFLQMDICYFFIPDAEPQEYDLTKKSTDLLIKGEIE